MRKIKFAAGKTMKICIALLTYSCEKLLKSRRCIYTKVIYCQNP